LARTVSVAFPLPIRKTFTYLAPESLRESLRTGSRVRAPFGDRVLSGVVVEEDPEAPSGVEPREIVEALDDEPALSPELLDTTRRLAERFFAPWGEILRAALPARLPSPRQARYEITSAGAGAVPFAGAELRGILESFLEQGRLTAAQVQEASESSGRARAALRELESRGWIRPAAPPRRPGRRTVTYASLPLSEEEKSAAAGRSRKAREALAHLEALGRPASAAELRQAGFSPSVLRGLAGKGVVAVSEEEAAAAPVAAAEHVSELPHRLSAEQAAAFAPIEEAILRRRFFPALLHGVTGSGKTEIYLHAIARALEAGRAAVWLVPEIALTPVFARSLTRRFGSRAVVLHSALSDRERAAAWEAMRRGDARVAIGPRSAVFAPLADIGLFVVDEEHDASYKQEESPRYDARDAAALRARALHAALVLGSATPSMETFHAAREGRLALLRLNERVEKRPLPEVFVIDLRGEPALPEEKGAPLFSRPLIARLQEVFSRGEQAILLAPRRGYAPFLLCRDCGNDFRCDSCSVPRVVHRRQNALVCHYCGSRRAPPARCDRCAGRVLEAVGAGTERAAERFAELFPGVPHAILDADTARQRGAAASVVSGMEGGHLQALIGTQMVAKGHHFENVTSIGVLSADTILNFPDFRAGEKTFQLVAQAAGRSGRGIRPGTVHIQTFHPEHEALRAAIGHDTEGFALRELEFRKTFFYPPYSEMAAVVVSSSRRETAAAAAEEIAARLAGRPDLRASGSAPAPLERLQGRWRFQILLRSASRKAVLSALEEAVPETPPAGCHVAAIVDPRNLM
jgi:primosomal protein N' (replication factor Y)